MSRQKYTHVQILLPEIRAMETAGKTKREIAEHFALRDKYVVNTPVGMELRDRGNGARGTLGWCSLTA